MSTAINVEQREIVARLAAEILPGSQSQPAASSIDIAASALDRVLRADASLEPRLCSLLTGYGGCPATFLDELTDTDFDLLMTVICGAYVMDPAVRRALGYEGQQALTPNRGGFGAEELVIDMMQRKKRYRRL